MAPKTILRDTTERTREEKALPSLSSAVEQAARSVFIAGRSGVIEYVNLERIITPLKDAQGRITHFAAAGHDITEHMRAEEKLRLSHDALRTLAAHLVSAREDERARIAREIHDELGQMLTGLKIDLSWLAARLPHDQPALRQKIQGMSGLVDTTIQSVRRIATELRPSMLDDLGLLAAIEWQVQEFQARTGICCQLTSNLPDPDVDGDIATAMFRILQETLTNVARHAEATRVEIALTAEADRLVLTVRDNGRGITPAEIASAKSVGLMGMQERAHLLGGEFSVACQPGHGTTVTVAIPHKPRLPVPS